MPEKYQDNAQVCFEYSEFIEEYNKFLNYQMQAKQLTVAIKTLKGRNTQVSLLYAQAVEAQSASIKAYTRMIVIYTRFVEKILEQYPRIRI